MRLFRAAAAEGNMFMRLQVFPASYPGNTVKIDKEPFFTIIPVVVFCLRVLWTRNHWYPTSSSAPCVPGTRPS